MNKPIPVNIINLEERTDRRIHIYNEFRNRPEFHIKLWPAIKSVDGATGFWQTILKLVQFESKRKTAFFILCEDDHQFTEHYSPEMLTGCLKKAAIAKTQILCGGISGFDMAVQISKNVFWVRKFSGLQFTIIFRRFYPDLLNLNFLPGDALDFRIAALSESKFVIYPFISTQKEFGYSDVTLNNNEIGKVDSLFSSAQARLAMLNRIHVHYNSRLMK